MKLWKKRAISAVMAAAMAIVALSGCGNKQESANDDDIVITVSGFIPSEEAEPEKYEQVMKQIEEFEALHPNIKIKESPWILNDEILFDLLFETPNGLNLYGIIKYKTYKQL